VTPDTAIPNSADQLLRVSATLTQAQLDNPATRVRIGLDRLISPGVYQEDVSIPFVGGPNQGRGGTVTQPPSFNMNLAEFQGATLRAFLDLPERISIGGVIETIAG
jgi:hypothetical protein